MIYKDYYQILGVSRTASTTAIRSAYRKLAIKHHPDHNPGDKQAEEKFKEINEAYQVLSNPEKRASYDLLGGYFSHQYSNTRSEDYDQSRQYTKPANRQTVDFDDFLNSTSFKWFRNSFGAIVNWLKMTVGYIVYRPIISAIFVFGILLFFVLRANFIEEYRCYFTDCPPTSWKEIRDVAFTQAGNDFRIASISAFPPQGLIHKITETEPAFINISISYISIKESASNGIGYSEKRLWFDDRSLFLTDDHYSSDYRSEPPPSTLVTERIKRVTVSPREAYRVTWKLAERLLSHPVNASNEISARLLFDDATKRKFGRESVWAVEYHNESSNGVVYTGGIVYVDAQTGKVILSEITP
jgi:hypothetical protein